MRERTQAELGRALPRARSRLDFGVHEIQAKEVQRGHDAERDPEFLQIHRDVDLEKLDREHAERGDLAVRDSASNTKTRESHGDDR